MPRKEFSRSTKAAAFLRADGRCEGTLDDGSRCPTKLTVGKFHYDHDNPDGLTGEPTLENCKCLCLGCHKVKTKEDRSRIDKAKRQQASHIGAKTRKGRPMAGTKASGLRKRMNGQVERRGAQ